MGRGGGDPGTDTNGIIAALLRDLAAAQSTEQRRWGYKRAAAAIRDLEAPVESYIRTDGTLGRIPHVGPASTRVIFEVLNTGRSATVDRQVAESPRAGDIEKSRRLRSHFLSRAQVVAILADGSLRGPSLSEYQGDLQMHSVWSDGTQTLAGIVDAALARGYRYCAVTDHSYGLPVARGMSMAAVAEQHIEIDALQQRTAFRLLKGIEANIKADGALDMEPGELRLFDIVVAAPHSAVRKTIDQTDRLLRAVTTPGVHILGHPRGRMYGTRGGIQADWKKVFAAAAQARVAIEIDGDPARQDIDYELARAALAAGCLFALDSDAHSTNELVFAETALAHARFAAVPPARIINCWPLEKLLSWSTARKPR